MGSPSGSRLVKGFGVSEDMFPIIDVTITDVTRAHLEDGNPSQGVDAQLANVLRDAWEARRPRPLEEGERVQTGSGNFGEVLAVHGGDVWVLFFDGTKAIVALGELQRAEMRPIDQTSA